MLNNINNSNRTNQVQFGALILNKPFEKWNEDVLVATLRSRVIRGIIAEDAKAGRDTFMAFKTTVKSAGKTDPITDIMSLDVNEGRQGLHFESKTTRTPVRNGIFGKYEYVISGAKNLGQAIADQIRSLDIQAFSRKKAIDEITEIAGGIVTEA